MLEKCWLTAEPRKVPPHPPALTYQQHIDCIKIEIKYYHTNISVFGWFIITRIFTRLTSCFPVKINVLPWFICLFQFLSVFLAKYFLHDVYLDIITLIWNTKQLLTTKMNKKLANPHWIAGLFVDFAKTGGKVFSTLSYVEETELQLTTCSCVMFSW